MSTYKPFDKALLSTDDDHWLFQGVADHVQLLLGDRWHPATNVENLKGTPQAVKDAWYLWWFACEVSGNGFNGYIGNGSCSCAEIQAVRAAMKAVSASELLEMLESSIPLSNEYEPPFWQEPEAKQFRSLKASKKWSSLDEMDEASMELASQPLSKLVAQHVRSALAI